MAALHLTQITKQYPNGYQAIHQLDLSIDDGELVVLVGPSGCGKSTLLRMIAGLETITSGELKISDRRVNDLEPSERDIAMVFQNYALYPHMTVYNNMAYGLKNQRKPKDEIHRLVTQAADMLELSHLLDLKPKQLSGGQRQRVAMGRAIVRKPEVFLFDEPLSNLDARLRVQMRLEIKKLQRRLATTAVYVTHDQVEAMTLADKLVVLNQGHIEQVGTPLSLYDKPASLFVATFIGSPEMNILDVEIIAQAIRINPAVQIDTRTAHLPYGAAKLGFRPEHCVITESDSLFRVEVEMTESLGADLLIYCRTLDENKQTLIVRAEGHINIVTGDTFGVSIDRANLHLFDTETSRRLDLHSEESRDLLYA